MRVSVVLAAGTLLVLAVSAWAAPANSSYYAAVREDAPLVYYGFDDSAGPVAADLSGNGRNGAYGNKLALGQTSASPGLGSAVAFGGGNVAVPALGKYSQLSLEYWIKPASLGGLRSLYTVDGWYPAALHNQLFDAADRISLSGNGGGDDRDFGGIVADAWQHVVLTYDSAARTVIEYVDGVARTAQTWTAAQAPVLNPAHIGQWLSVSFQRPYLGAMDEFAVYGKVLSPDRVRAHFSAASYGNLVRADSPKLYYRLNEAPGADVVRDASGRGRRDACVRCLERGSGRGR